MKRLLPLLLWVALAGGAWAEDEVPAPEALALANAPDVVQLEKGLQSLTWPQFRAVIQAVPKLKAEVDAYGAFGWQYVQARYQTYRWQKSINKLDVAQQRELADLIAQAKAGKLPLRPADGRS